MTRKSLLQLFECHQGKVADKWQLYLDQYERLLSRYRDQPVRILEIGVQNGGSLEIWSEYFSRAEIIIGCDIDPTCTDLVFDDPRITVIVSDVNSAEAQAEISAVSTEFDIIIDDGSHRSGDIIRSFGLLFPKLALGGSYIIEDLHCSYWEVYQGGLNHPFSSIAFLKSLTDILNRDHWGLDKESDAIFEGFKTVYGADIDGESLRLVHSVEFTDSICRIQKLPRNKNALGKRVISGRNALVTPTEELSSPTDEASIVPSQIANQWANGSYPSADELLLKIHELHEQKQLIARLFATIEEHDNRTEESLRAIKERDKRIEESLRAIKERDDKLELLKQSLSWRLTKPLRRLQKNRDSNEPHQRKDGNKCSDLATDPAELEEHRRRGHVGSDTAHSSHEALSRSTPAEDKFIRSTRPLYELLKLNRPNSDEKRWSGNTSDADQNDYLEWVRRYDTLRDTDRIRIRHAMANLVNKPLLSVLIPVNDPMIEWLKQAVDSIQYQTYDNWELCIAADISSNESEREYLTALSENNARIKTIFCQLNGQYCTAASSALEICTGSWVALMGQEDILPEHALFNVANAINQHPETCLIYSDEDKIDKNGTRLEPYFKCDWNRELFYSHNYISRLGVYRRDLLDEIGGFREGFRGAEDYDLALRYIEKIDSRAIRHIPKVLYRRRSHPEEIAPGVEVNSSVTAASHRALQEHLDRTGVKATVDSTPIGNEVHYSLPEIPPLVSLIIPTRNGLNLLKTCLNSIQAKTAYPNFEILVVDNGSDDPATIDYMAGLKSSARIRVLHDARPFNYAELNNSAVQEARGELICLLNNDTEVIEEQWLTEMVSIALQPRVGFVGAKLLYPDGTIQHAGVILGIRGVAAHVLKRAPGDSPGYFNRAKHIGTFSVLTGACLVVKKNVFLETGGFDSQNLAIAFNDIDLCLRVRELGYRNIFTPHALLYHHESASRGMEDTAEKKVRFAKEVKFMKKRWGNELLHDPAYNPNLSLDDQNFSLAWPPRTNERYLP